MKRKILVIDYLRGLSILSLILVHIILPLRSIPPTEYSAIPILFTLRDLLNLCVITLITCSGFSLYISTKNLDFNFENILAFYKKRLKRLFLPWANYVVVSFLVYGIVRLFAPGLSAWLLRTYPFLNVANYGGIPIAWITLKWIVILLIILTLLFPVLRYIYEKKPVLIAVMIVVYAASVVLLKIYPSDFYQYRELKLFRFPMLFMIISFVFGWSLVYIFGFSLEKLYNDRRFMKKDMKITFMSILLFIAIYIVYRSLGFSTLIDSNKFPPSPYFISLGIAVTLVLLSVFISFKPLFRSHPRSILEFFSANSYWLYLWSLLILFFSNYIFSLFDINTYIKLFLEFLFNCVALYLIVKAEKHIKIDIYIEKQNF